MHAGRRGGGGGSNRSVPRTFSRLSSGSALMSFTSTSAAGSSFDTAPARVFRKYRQREPRASFFGSEVVHDRSP